MKKTLFWVLVAIISGAFLGKVTFDRYENVEVQNVISINDEIYALKYGTYHDLDEMQSNVTEVDRYVYVEKDDKVKAYVAFSTTKKNINKIKNLYDSKKINLKVEKITINNDEFIQNLNEYEKLLEATFDEKSLLIIENQILSCYEKTVISDE